MEPNAAWIGKEASSPWELVHSPARRPTAWQRDGHPTDRGGGEKGGPTVGSSNRPGTKASGATRVKDSGSRPLEEAKTRRSLYPLRSRLSGLARGERGNDASVVGTALSTQAAKNIGTKKNDSCSDASAPSEPKLYNKARAEPSPARQEAHALYTGVLASNLRLKDLLEKQLPSQQQQQQHPPGPRAVQDEMPEGILSQHPTGNTEGYSIAASTAGSQRRCGISDSGGAARSQLVLLACALVNTPHSAAKNTSRLDLPEAAGEAVAQQQCNVAGEEQCGVKDRIDFQVGSIVEAYHMPSGAGAVLTTGVAPAAVAVVEDGDLTMEELDSCLATGAATLQVELPTVEATAAPASLLSDYLTSGVGASRRAASRPAASPLAVPGPSPFCTPNGRGKCQQQSLLRCSSPLDLFHAIQSAQTRAVQVAARAAGLTTMPTPTHKSLPVDATAQQPAIAGTPGFAAFRIRLPDPCPVENPKASSSAAVASVPLPIAPNRAGARNMGTEGVMANATSAAINSEGEVVAEGRITRSRSRSQLNTLTANASSATQELPNLRGVASAPKHIEDGSTTGFRAGSVTATAPVNGGIGVAAAATGNGSDRVGSITLVPVAIGDGAADTAAAAVITAGEANTAGDDCGSAGNGGKSSRGGLGGITTDAPGMEKAAVTPSACGTDHNGGKQEDEDGENVALRHGFPKRQASLRAGVQVQSMAGEAAGACAGPAAPGPANDNPVVAAADADQPAKQKPAVTKAVPSPTASTPGTDPWATILELAAHAVATCDTRDPQAVSRDMEHCQNMCVAAAGGATRDGGMIVSAHASGVATSSRAADNVAGELVAAGAVGEVPAAAATNMQLSAAGGGDTGAPSSAGDQQPQPVDACAVARSGFGEGERVKGTAGRAVRARRGRGRGRPSLGAVARGGHGAVVVRNGQTPKRKIAVVVAAAVGVTPATKLCVAFPDGANGEESSPDVPISILAAAATALDAAAAVQPEALGAAVPAEMVTGAVTPAATQPKRAAAAVAVAVAAPPVSTPGVMVPELASAGPIGEIPDSADLPIGVLAAAAAAHGTAATRSPGSSPGSRRSPPPPPPSPAANQSGGAAAAVAGIPATDVLAALYAAGPFPGLRSRGATPGVVAPSCETSSVAAPEAVLANKSRTARDLTHARKLERRKRRRRSSSSGAPTAPAAAAVIAGGAAEGGTAALPDDGKAKEGVGCRCKEDVDRVGIAGMAGASQEAGPEDMEYEAATAEVDDGGIQPGTTQPSSAAPASCVAPPPPPLSNAAPGGCDADEGVPELHAVSASTTQLAAAAAVESMDDPMVMAVVATAPLQPPPPAGAAVACAPAGRVQFRQLWKRPRNAGVTPPMAISSMKGSSRLSVAGRMRQQTPPPPPHQSQPTPQVTSLRTSGDGSNQRLQQQHQGDCTPGEPHLLPQRTTAREVDPVERAAAQAAPETAARQQQATGAGRKLGTQLLGVQGGSSAGEETGWMTGAEGGGGGSVGRNQGAEAPPPSLQPAQEVEEDKGTTAVAVGRDPFQLETLVAVPFGDGDSSGGDCGGSGPVAAVADAAAVGLLSTRSELGRANTEAEVHAIPASGPENMLQPAATNRVHIRSIWKRPRLAEAARQAAHGSGRPTGRRALLCPRIVGQPEAAPTSGGAASSSGPGSGPGPVQGLGIVVAPRAGVGGDDYGRTGSGTAAAAVSMISSMAAGDSDFAAPSEAPTVADGECEVRLQQRQMQPESAVGKMEAGRKGTKGGKSQAAADFGLLGQWKQEAGLSAADAPTEATTAPEVEFAPKTCGDDHDAAAAAMAERNAEAPGVLMDVDVPTAKGYMDADMLRSSGAADAAAVAAGTPTAPIAAGVVMQVALGGGPLGGEVIHRTPPRMLRTSLGSLTPIAAAPSPKGSVGGSIGKPPRSPGGLRAVVGMSLSPGLASSPLPPSRGPTAASAAGLHRLRDPSVHPAAVACSSGLSPVQPLLSKPQAATVRSPSTLLPIPAGDGAWAVSQAAASPMTGSAAILAAMAADGPLVALPAARVKLPMAPMSAVERRAAATAEVSFLHPLAPIRTKPPQLSPIPGNIPLGVKPSVVQAVEALLSIPLLGEDSSPSSSGGTAAGDAAATSPRAADGDIVMAESAPSTAMAAAVAGGVDAIPPSASGACRLEKLLDAAAETHGSVGRRPTPLTLLVDVAAVAQGSEEISSQKHMIPVESSVDSNAAIVAAVCLPEQGNGDGGGGGAEPLSERPKIFRSALRDVQPFFSTLGPCAAAPAAAPAAARSPLGPAPGGLGSHNGGPVCSLVCEERLDMFSGKAASPLPPRPRPAGKGPPDTRAGVGLSRLGGGRVSPSKTLVSGQADSPLPSLRPSDGYNTPPFRSGKHRTSLHHGVLGWQRSGDLYPGHQYDSMIEDVVQQMLNEGSPESPSPLELGRQLEATAAAEVAAAAAVLAPAEAATVETEAKAPLGVRQDGVTDIVAHHVPVPLAAADEDGVMAMDDVAPGVTTLAGAETHFPLQQEQQQATSPSRRSIYLPSPTGKRRRSGDPEDYDVVNVAKAPAAATAAEASATVDPHEGGVEAQPPSSGHRRRPRKAPRVDGGASRSAAAAAVAAAAAAAAASNQVSLGELLNLGAEDPDSDDGMLDSYADAAAAAGGSGGGGHGSERGGPGRSPGAVLSGKLLPYGAPGGGNWMKPGLAWSRTAVPAPPPPGYHYPTSNFRMGYQLRAAAGAGGGAGPYRSPSSMPGHHNPGGGSGRFALAAPAAPPAGAVGGASEQDSDPGDIMLDVPRTLALQRGSATSRRQGTYLSSYTEAGNTRPTLEQEYREAFINAQLAQAWTAGERWARCDLAGLPADISRRGVVERLAVLNSAASKLNCYRGTEGAAKIMAKVKDEWEHLKRIRMTAASRSTVRTPTGVTPSPAPRGLSFGRHPHTPLPFAAHLHAAAAGAAAAKAAAAAEAAAAAAGTPRLQRMGQSEEEEGSAVVMATPPPQRPPQLREEAVMPIQLDQGMETHGTTRERQLQQQQQHGVHHHGLAQLVSAHVHCHRGSPPPATAAAAASQRPYALPHPHHHHHGQTPNHPYYHPSPNHTANGCHEKPLHHQHQQPHQFHSRHNPQPHGPVRNSLSHHDRAAAAAVRAELPQQESDGNLASLRDQAGDVPALLHEATRNVNLADAAAAAAAAGGGAEGFATPAPRVARSEGDRSATTPPQNNSRLSKGDLSATSLLNLQQQMTPPASILKTVPTPYTAFGMMATPVGGGGGLVTGSRKAVKFATVLELGPQSGYRHAERPVPPPRPAFDQPQSQMPAALDPPLPPPEPERQQEEEDEQEELGHEREQQQQQE